MKIFFDTEFTGLHKDTTLISIGIIAQNGDKFYAELTDYDKSQIDSWIEENVIQNLWGADGGYDGDMECPEYYHGSKEFVGNKLKEWLEQYDTVEFVSDVCHYDFVLLIDLVYGHAMKMPYGKINAACHDINQDISRYYGISEIEAFDKSREDILKDFAIELFGVKHNALYDAKAIQAIYDALNNRV